MPKISFRILSTAAQRDEIEQDFRTLIDSFGPRLDAELAVKTGLTPDPELETTWVELFGETSEDDPTSGTTLDVAVANYEGGSISGLAMQFAHLLTVIEDEPAEPLLREVKDDPGTPRVPWHLEVAP
ncbi:MULTISPECIES: hypothetical protein [Corynebacterium]|uniref:Uncharacterized protein n=1 Tax=Corynebacterium urealyticum TaxID=43771 RepID=A0A2W5B8N9_9CORY|nr:MULTISPECIES: hypothetical protein [Corynebacterium]MDK8791278.1 hypothetical protein [Corynebacterium sp. MSK039]PZP01778.1 MAG: hypothetical protein DI609_03445 [Corynebacterium urealyticum]TYR20252.1 hypothetical protein FYJ87_04595 [Corynebacterium urealyticum]WOH93655.1 hypothetical protein RZ943_05985 [Corynebacterium urealyticum]